jgi:acyl carrier protein
MASIDRNSVLTSVCGHLAEILEIDVSSISEAQAFATDLGADSISLIELVDSLEQEFSATMPDFQFDDDDLADLRTVADAVDYIVRAFSK